MARVAIIPARGGSKRIPRKNIKPFFGKPIIAYSIEAALESNLFEAVMVSTDDAEIADVAKRYGAKVPFLRSERNANDFSTTVDVLLEVIETYEKAEAIFEYGCCIYPTAPFVTKDVLAKGYEQMIFGKFDTVFPIVRFSFPVQRALCVDDKTGKIRMFSPEHINTRSQDLEASFHDAGQFYWFKIEALKRHKKLWADNSGYIETNELMAQDIDNATDWKLAELKYKLKNK
ncbi:pseudaminic acid cytidylyltransferase [Ulvibacterium marinum]|uniref:Pseudaminic acid cytidylyltransferase n=1 Tax=Ulvibacterium marinum TaxID=2419782 RepID=A0A3B0CDV2_9FLAO|nr:pseudaminic acid cytidylyltransferase [Ulvibacterium marinum]RKN82774.1 pseudaminic acid cytidylyltransferase [Ulvibacterium marinum]